MPPITHARKLKRPISIAHHLMLPIEHHRRTRYQRLRNIAYRPTQRRTLASRLRKSMGERERRNSCGGNK